MNLNKEAAVLIGTVVTIIVGAIGVLSGNGIISDVLAGRAIDIVNSIGELLVLLSPLIAGILIRPQVFSKDTVQQVANTAAATGSPVVTTTPP